MDDRERAERAEQWRIVLRACSDSANPTLAMTAIRAIATRYFATGHRAEQAEAELAKLKAEIHAAVDAAPDAMETI